LESFFTEIALVGSDLPETSDRFQSKMPRRVWNDVVASEAFDWPTPTLLGQQLTYQALIPRYSSLTLR
jgi:hypothetical protein